MPVCSLGVITWVLVYAEVVSVAIDVGLFFFQAEDGIRYLVRSRGLGDVYKRQGDQRDRGAARASGHGRSCDLCPGRPTLSRPAAVAVSYTHLTLPTSDLV